MGDPSGWELDDGRCAGRGAGVVVRAGQPLQRRQRDPAVVVVDERHGPAAQPRPARQRQRRRPVREERRVASPPYGLRSITFDQLQTVEGIATDANSMVETKKFATYYVENYCDPYPRIARMVFKSRRPGNTNGTALWNHLCRCEITDLLTVADRASWRRRLPRGGVLRRRHALHRAGRAAPSSRSSSCPWTCQPEGALHDEPVRRGRTDP